MQFFDFSKNRLALGIFEKKSENQRTGWLWAFLKKKSENQRTGWLWAFLKKIRESKNRLALGIFEKKSENQRTGWLWVFFEKLRESKNRIVPGISKAGSFLVFPGSLAFKVFSRSVPRAGASENGNCYIYIYNRLITEKDPTLPQRTAQH